MGWLQEHLETFVRPYLGYIPVLKKDAQPYFSRNEMILLKNVWRSVKRDAQRFGLPILLTGRDVWIFHVLACRENYEHAYRPDISRQTKLAIKENYKNFLCLDTGYSGTIATALGCKRCLLLSSSIASATTVFHGVSLFQQNKTPLRPISTDLKQVFPRSKSVRNLASRLEQMPKYWHTAYWKNPAEVSAWSLTELSQLRKDNWDAKTGIAQAIASPKAFEAAAKLTIQIYRDSSPEFSEKPLEIATTPPPPRPDWIVEAIM